MLCGKRAATRSKMGSIAVAYAAHNRQAHTTERFATRSIARYVRVTCCETMQCVRGTDRWAVVEQCEHLVDPWRKRSQWQFVDKHAQHGVRLFWMSVHQAQHTWHNARNLHKHTRQ